MSKIKVRKRERLKQLVGIPDWMMRDPAALDAYKAAEIENGIETLTAQGYELTGNNSAEVILPMFPPRNDPYNQRMVVTIEVLGPEEEVDEEDLWDPGEAFDVVP